MNSSKIFIVVVLGILIRWTVSLAGYSGARKGPMFGDYEAQRHWMEVTVNLPVNEWYHNTSRNNLMYWGLDYPPLTAYHSWICGRIAQFINPEWVELNKSRGYESYEHKLFMRYTVLAVDIMVYFPAVYWIFAAKKVHLADTVAVTNQEKGFLLMLMYPGLMLIDHGHFQYNCISLGFTLLAVTSLLTGREIIGSALFYLALNYKQMELYHAMPFFCYLLGSCLKSFRNNGFFRLVKIGTTVIITTGLCWFPFLYSKHSMLQVLHRLFPFARGVFEDKVSNIWCSLSVVIKWKQILTVDQIVLLCLVTTLLFLLPSSIDLLLRPTVKKFKLALINSSLVFFLFSFQVHEKSILIPALIVCVLIPERPFWCFWFLIISTFSMLPLLLKDGHLVTYISTMVLYCILYYNFYPTLTSTKEMVSDKPQWTKIISNLLFCISMVGVVILTFTSVLVPPPTHLPDLFPLMISVYSCAHFLMFLAYFHHAQLVSEKPVVKFTERTEIKKTDGEPVKAKVGKKNKHKKKKQH